MPSIDDFKKAVFMGDSLTVGMGQTVGNIPIYATVGHTVGQGSKKYKNSIIKDKPSMIVISYGTNDAEYKRPDSFKKDFIELINDLKAGVPGIVIYVNKIFPGLESKASGTGLECIKNIPSYNEALNEVVKETGVTLLDCTQIPDLSTYYSSDGIHFNSAFYKKWYEKMQELITNGASSSTTIQIQKKLMPKDLDGTCYSSKKQTNTYIVVHNTSGRVNDNVSTAAKTVSYFHSNEANAKTSAHFCIDDKEIIQILELDWKGHHTKGGSYHSEWGITKGCGASNSNSVGIEVADGPNVNHNGAIELLIELCRHIMKELNIGVDNVVRHADTQDKDCPWTINNLNKWDYIKDEIKKRNEANQPITFTVNSNGTTSTGTVGIVGTTPLGTTETPLYATPTDIEVQLPDVDHRENITNMDEVRGVSIHYYPPYMSNDIEGMEDYFKSLNWPGTYHYLIGKIDPNRVQDDTPDEDEEIEGEAGGEAKPEARQPVAPEDPDTPEEPVEPEPEDTTIKSSFVELNTEGYCILKSVDELYQTKAFTDNDMHTYIDRALFQGKRQKHNITVGLMCPSNPDDYPTYEKALIEGLGLILHEHALEVKDLWREFDLNRAPSPFAYLDRDKWKDLLCEVEKQLNWRNIKFGKYTKTYEKYTAGSSGLSGGSTGSINPGTITSGGGGGSFGSLGGGDWTQGQIGGDCLLFIKSEEGFAPNSYTPPEGGGNKAIGYGCTKFPGTANPAFEAMSSQQPITEEIAAKYLADEINKNYAAPILDCCKNTLKITKQCQFDALVSVSYNAGPGSITNSSSKLHQAIKKNPDDEATIRACWENYKITGGGKPMPGLVTRRKKECDMYFGKAVDYKKIAIVGGGGGYVTDNDGKGWLPTADTTNDNSNTENDDNNNENTENNDSNTEATSYNITPRDVQGPDSGAGGSGNDNTGTDTSNNSNIFGWPLPGISKVSSKFGPRKAPCAGASTYHGGIDIGAASGTPILAYAGGEIVQNTFHSKAGNYIKIDHGNGVATRYLHMVKKSPLAVGTIVQAGQEVGQVGNTGVGTGAHLHFEIHINGTKVDPLLYVNPGGGTRDNPTINPGQGSTGSGPGSITGGTIGSDSDNLLYDDKKQDNTNALIGENSAGGEQHNDWGGKMIYEKGEPEDANAEQPEILNIISQEEFLEIIQYSDFKLVDDYVFDFEPYSKGLATVDGNEISTDDRISAMTKKFTTQNENTFHYKVIESGPGSKDHCVTIAEELNYLAVPEALTVEPIYPDLVIPPGYVSTEADKANQNSIPIAVIEQNGSPSSDMFTKQFSFDYDLLKDQKKESNKLHHPVNYADPYPYDDKITDLERHYPKVFIDEIEGQLYSCNHPGCPISQPMAKNFAMVSDAMMNQSKRIEKRLSRIENILSTVIRNQGRLGSRMNINCVYYGGHSTFNKYKCIRCLHDDRVHDGELVTIDQCLNCTRFEPILGQVYRILDDSGLNGSIILDDMQMSYTDLQGYKNLNDITCRSSRYYNALAAQEVNCSQPEKTLSDLWKEADKQQAIATIKETGASDAEDKIKALKEEDYIFKMDWAESFFNSQEPDTKPYLNEGIVARQKVQQGDGASLEDTLAQLDPELDADEIEEIKERIKIRDNIWIDTREIADTVQVNKYTSENFLFEDFNKVRIGKYGIKFSSSYNYNGEDYTSIYSVSSINGGSNLANGSTGAFASDVRNKICDMAKQIVADYDAGKAKYCQRPRTVDYTKPQSSGGKVCYDCTSFVSCCYLNAGLNSMYNKSCSGKTMVQEINKGGLMFLCNEANLAQARPGDVLIRAKKTLSEADMNKFVETEHAMIYLGDGKAAHASSPSIGIKIVELGNRLTKGTYFFARPADLIEADKQADQQAANAGLSEQSGSIDGKNYIMKIPQAVCTAYTDKGKGSSGMGCTYNATCASHNMPYGTKIYIPYLNGKAGDGVFTVTDCGGPFFDFDINTNTWSEKVNADAYVLEWGTGKNATSYTYSIDEQVKLGQWNKYKSAWGIYKNMGGKLVNLHKFDATDANIKTHARYND